MSEQSSAPFAKKGLPDPDALPRIFRAGNDAVRAAYELGLDRAGGPSIPTIWLRLRAQTRLIPSAEQVDR